LFYVTNNNKYYVPVGLIYVEIKPTRTYIWSLRLEGLTAIFVSPNVWKLEVYIRQ